MKRRTHLFIVAIDEDPIAGGMDRSRIKSDVEHVIKNAFISAYNPQVEHLTMVERPSNFTEARDLTGVITLTLGGVTDHGPHTDLGFDMHYPAERPD